MVYTPKQWANGASGNTPITAAELNRIEQGVADAHGLAEDAAGTPPVASSTEAGLMSPAHFQLVDGASENFSNNTIVRRSSTGGIRATFFELAAAPAEPYPTDLVPRQYVDDLIAGLTARIEALENN